MLEEDENSSPKSVLQPNFNGGHHTGDLSVDGILI
jgi:hypothetical protein